MFQKTHGFNSESWSYRHEQAYLAAKVEPTLPAEPISDVLATKYTGNKLDPNSEGNLTADAVDSGLHNFRSTDT